MSDEADRAAEEEEAFRNAALQTSLRAARSSAPGEATQQLKLPSICENCGDHIPEARRRAVPGTRRCTECQSRLERRVA